MTKIVAIHLHFEDFIMNLSTWCDDEGQARDGGRLGDFASWGSGFLRGFQLVGDASGRPPTEGRPGARAVAPEPNAPQVGNHPV